MGGRQTENYLTAGVSMTFQECPGVSRITQECPGGPGQARPPAPAPAPAAPRRVPSRQQPGQALSRVPSCQQPAASVSSQQPAPTPPSSCGPRNVPQAHQAPAGPPARSNGPQPRSTQQAPPSGSSMPQSLGLGWPQNGHKTTPIRMPQASGQASVTMRPGKPGHVGTGQAAGRAIPPQPRPVSGLGTARSLHRHGSALLPQAVPTFDPRPRTVLVYGPDPRTGTASSHTLPSTHGHSQTQDLQEMMDDGEREHEHEQEKEQEQDEEKQDEEEERRRQIDRQIREQEEIDWSISDKTGVLDSYLVEASSRARPLSQKSLIPNEDDLECEIFCGYTLRQIQDLQEADSDLRIVKHWVRDGQVPSCKRMQAARASRDLWAYLQHIKSIRLENGVLVIDLLSAEPPAPTSDTRLILPHAARLRMTASHHELCCGHLAVDYTTRSVQT